MQGEVVANGFIAKRILKGPKGDLLWRPSQVELHLMGRKHGGEPGSMSRARPISLAVVR